MTFMAVPLPRERPGVGVKVGGWDGGREGGAAHRDRNKLLPVA